MMIVAKKSLGQHWLHDTASLQAMCDAAVVDKTDTVLEIGPGLGSLTELLVRRAQKVIAIELDERLAQELPQRVPAANLEVKQANILTFDLTTLPKGYKVVANIPYYLTSHMLRLLCESINPPLEAALLVQKEVAERVCAKPGAMSLLSVSVQVYCQTSLGQLVPAKFFTPPPKVDSQILRLKRHTTPLFSDIDPKLFFRVVKAGYSARRKTVLNSLGAGLHMSRAESAELIARAGLNAGARAQELTLKDWYSLAKQLAGSPAPPATNT